MLVFDSLLDLAQNNPKIFDSLPELGFLLPIAQTIKRNGCKCGLGSTLEEANIELNQTILNLNEDQIARFKKTFERNQLIFGLQTQHEFKKITL